VSEVLAYTVRESSRARHVRLRVTNTAAVEVVVPSGFDRRWLPEMLRTRQAWLERAVARAQVRLSERSPLVPPVALELRAIGERWTVEYRETSSARTIAREHSDGVVVVHGPADDRARQRALRRWLCRHLDAPMDARLRALAIPLGCDPALVRLHWQRSRWGSCSAAGNINLNTKLGFLPPQLVDHVMLHELAHLEVFDHSPAFYDLLSGRDMNAAENICELRDAWRYVPLWLDLILDSVNKMDRAITS